MVNHIPSEAARDLKLKTTKLRLLNIGPLPPPLGGVTVLFKELVERLDAFDDVHQTVIDTVVRGKGLQAKASLLLISIRLAFEALRADVLALHVTNTRLLSAGKTVMHLGRLLGKPVIIRKFGGPDHRTRAPDFKKLDQAYIEKVESMLRHVQLYLAETKASVSLAHSRGVAHTHWFPNHRSLDKSIRHSIVQSKTCRRFAFVSHVRAGKGIPELIEAADSIDPDLGITVDVYGSLFGDVSRVDFANRNNIRYIRELTRGEVAGILSEYHAVVLPSRHDGEGHPGILVEAFSLGLPVISTNWQSIPEIVDDSCGLLVEPGDAAGLKNAIVRLASEPDLFERIKHGAFKKRTLFDSDEWVRWFADRCIQLSRANDG